MFFGDKMRKIVNSISLPERIYMKLTLIRDSGGKETTNDPNGIGNKNVKKITKKENSNHQFF